MNRRESLKALGIGTLSADVLLKACKPANKDGNVAAIEANAANEGRQPFEIERDKKIKSDKFFTDHEIATITVLADIIIPKDNHSGSASDAKVPEFIDFIVKDIPDHQVPMRGGLKWLDLICLNRYNNPFKDCNATQQTEIVTEIAYPKKAKPGMEPGVTFFNKIRFLTTTGFFTSKMGMEDLGFVGNQPNKWEGVPADVLKQYGLENV